MTETILKAWTGATAFSSMPADFPSESSTQKNPLWSHRIDSLLAIRDLEDNWDGDGAKSPPKATVDSSIHLAIQLRDQGYRIPTRIVPGRTGSVIFEWQLPNDVHCEIEVLEPFVAECLLLRPGQKPILESYRGDLLP